MPPISTWKSISNETSCHVHNKRSDALNFHSLVQPITNFINVSLIWQCCWQGVRKYRDGKSCNLMQCLLNFMKICQQASKPMTCCPTLKQGADSGSADTYSRWTGFQSYKNKHGQTWCYVTENSFHLGNGHKKEGSIMILSSCLSTMKVNFYHSTPNDLWIISRLILVLPQCIETPRTSKFPVINTTIVKTHNTDSTSAESKVVTFLWHSNICIVWSVLLCVRVCVFFLLISWLAEDLSHSQERLWSMELVS
jgi:hypothetical protein